MNTSVTESSGPQIGNRCGPLLQVGYCLSIDDLIPGRDVHASHDARPVGAERLLHLHRFQNANGVSSHDLIPDIYRYRYDHARHGCLERPGGRVWRCGLRCRPSGRLRTRRQVGGLRFGRQRRRHILDIDLYHFSIYDSLNWEFVDVAHLDGIPALVDFDFDRRRHRKTVAIPIGSGPGRRRPRPPTQ